MAVRSGAGTGVVVSLVVFVLTTVFLLVMTIIFYAGQSTAIQKQAAAEAELAQYVRPAQRSQDVFSSLEAAAQASNQSVSEYLLRQKESLMALAAGDRTTTPEAFRAAIQQLGATDDASLLELTRQLQRSLTRRQTELDSVNRRQADREAEVAELQSTIDQLKESHEEALATVNAQIDDYRAAVEEYRQQLTVSLEEMQQNVSRLVESKERAVADLEDDKDNLMREINVLSGKIDEFQSILDDIRAKAKDPALLVDGNVIDVGGSDQVFIDRGREHRIVLGMTFEIYADKASLRVDRRTNMLPPGKASVQVIKVGQTTSTCKVTRSVPGLPVVRGDVIANAVYDPNYKFKFLIHGPFDIDGDGRPTEAEAEYLRSLVVEWGGEVITGVAPVNPELPGDLDFLVLGAAPVPPPSLRPDATDIEVRIHIKQRQAVETYRDLFNQASRAQIPVLNANRFLILIGAAER